MPWQLSKLKRYIYIFTSAFMQTNKFSETFISRSRSSHRRCSIEKSVIKSLAKYTGKHLCQVSFSKWLQAINFQGYACDFIKKETLGQMFSCKFCKIFITPFLQNNSGRLFLRQDNRITKFTIFCETSKLLKDYKLSAPNF